MKFPKVFQTVLLASIVALVLQFFKSESVPILAAEPSADSCLVRCKEKQSSAKVKNLNQLCLTSKYGDQECFYLDNIIMFTTYNGQSVVYDFDGSGKYVKESLIEIEAKVKRISGFSYFYRINRQDYINMIYASYLDRCKSTLYLCGDFESGVPRRKLNEVETLMHQYCSLMCQ